MTLNSPKIFVTIITVFCILLSFYWINKDKGIFNSDNYLSHAYNIVINKIYSGDTNYSGFQGEIKEIKPTWRRAPAWPLLASTVFVFTAQENNLIECFEQLKRKNCEDIFFIVKITNSLLFIFCILFIYRACLVCYPNMGIALTISLISAAILSKEMVISSHSEPLAITCYSAFCYFLFKWVLELKPKYSSVFACSIFLSVLILCRSAYLYYVPFFVLIFGLLLIRKNRFVIGKVKSMFLFLACLIVIVSPWLTRNYFLFGQFDVANSGAVQVLSIRYEFNQMETDEYLSGFIYWVPIPILSKRIQNSLNSKTFHRYKSESPDGFRQIGYKKGAALVKDIGYKNAKSYYFDKILNKPLKNMQMSLLFAWRGIHYAILFSPFFFVVLYFSIRRYYYNHYLLAFSLNIFNIFFHAFITHFNVRYGYPLVVGFAPALSIICFMFLKSQEERKHF